MMWNVTYSGTKGEIEKAMSHDKGLPHEVRKAIEALLTVHPEVPGFTDPDPARKFAAMSSDQWEAAMTAAGVVPVPPKPRARSEMLRTYWRVVALGGPEENVTCSVTITGVHEAK